jgi:MinD-like ATPase involved in chromosome partitioning or flagellar assembly
MPTLISLQSCRHGVGRTNLTANLAACIATQGYRVGVLDADGAAPGIHALFGRTAALDDIAINQDVWSNWTSDAAWGDRPLPFSGTAIPIGQGTMLLLGGDLCLVPPELRVQDVQRCLQQGYDPDPLGQGLRTVAERLGLEFLLIDTYPELDEGTMLWMAVSDAVVLVLGLDATEFQSLAVRMDIAHTLEVPQVWLLANQVPPAYGLGEVWRKLEHSYGKKALIGVLPMVDEMLALGSSGLFYLTYPDHPLSLALEAIAHQLIKAPVIKAPVIKAPAPITRLRSVSADLPPAPKSVD